MTETPRHPREKKAFDAGRVAYAHGLQRTENPYRAAVARKGGKVTGHGVEGPGRLVKKGGASFAFSNAKWWDLGWCAMREART